VSTIVHGERIDLLPSPYVVPTSDNEVTFTLALGEWRRLDEGVNVLSDFAPGTGLLYTNNNNGFDLNGQGSIGGGGSGPVEIAFARGVRAVGFQAQTNVLGVETFTFSAYDDSDLVGTFTVTRVNGQHEDGSASFLGVRTVGNERITRVVISSVVVQAGQPHVNDFSLGPVTYQPGPRGQRIAKLGFPDPIKGPALRAVRFAYGRRLYVY
jgi:hypothetical protein